MGVVLYYKVRACRTNRLTFAGVFSRSGFFFKQSMLQLLSALMVGLPGWDYRYPSRDGFLFALKFMGVVNLSFKRCVIYFHLMPLKTGNNDSAPG
jgi:hypothetical protein